MVRQEEGGRSGASRQKAVGENESTMLDCKYVRE